MNIKPYLLAAALAGVAIGNADAATKTFSDAFGPDRTAWTTTLSLPKFDPSLGTLNNVTINYSSTINTSGTIKNKDAEPKTLTVTVDANVTLNMPAGVTLAPMSANVMEVKDYPNLQPNVDQAVSVTGGNSSSATTSDAGDLAIFSGAGNVDFAASADSNSTVTGAANLASDIDTFAGVTVEVVYDYSVPLVSNLQCTNTLGGNGDVVSATVSGDEGCGNVHFVETITCNGDLAYTAAANTPGCTVEENPNGTFTATCDVDIAQNGTEHFSVISAVAGTNGTCTTSVTSMSCSTPSGSTLTADTSSCGSNYSIAPPAPVPSLPPIPPSIPTLSQWGLMLLAGMLTLIGFGASRRRS